MDELRSLMRQRLGIRGPSLAVQLAKARRGLPRRLRPAAQLLTSTEPMLAHPQMARRVDEQAAKAAAVELRKYLKSCSAYDRWVGMILNRTGVIGFNLLLIVGAVLVWIALR